MQKSNDDKIKIWNQENIERNSREYRKKSSWNLFSKWWEIFEFTN
jgi:hypothetical protein